MNALEVEEILIERNMEIVIHPSGGWTIIRLRSDERGPYEEWIGGEPFDSYYAALSAAIKWVE